jgi:hypothetical protein
MVFPVVVLFFDLFTEGVLHGQLFKSPPPLPHLENLKINFKTQLTCYTFYFIFIFLISFLWHKHTIIMEECFFKTETLTSTCRQLFSSCPQLKVERNSKVMERLPGRMYPQNPKHSFSDKVR